MTRVFRSGRSILFWAIVFATVWIAFSDWGAGRSGMAAGLLGTAALSVLYFARRPRLTPVKMTSASPLNPHDALDLDRFDFERG